MKKVMSHASESINTETHQAHRLFLCVLFIYLNPSAFGMNKLGLGGSLWQRGTLTGRGLFLGPEIKENILVKTPFTTEKNLQ